MRPDPNVPSVLFTAAIASGSNGNCYYIGNADDAVLVDAGISAKETERRMAHLGLSMEKVRGIFVSHEHTDHVRGLELLAHRWNLPVWGTRATLSRCRLGRVAHQAVAIGHDAVTEVGQLQIHAFRKRHDAADPISFSVRYAGVQVGIFTDIGRCCDNLIAHFRDCHGVFLEANYCEQLLAGGAYPYHLKKRISGGYGHISNREALEIFLAHRSPTLSHLLLSHLSGNNNTPERALETFLPHAGSTQVVVASRYAPSPLFKIRAGKEPLPVQVAAAAPVKAAQLSIF